MINSLWLNDTLRSVCVRVGCARARAIWSFRRMVTVEDVRNRDNDEERNGQIRSDQVVEYRLSAGLVTPGSDHPAFHARLIYHPTGMRWAVHYHLITTSLSSYHCPSILAHEQHSTHS